MGDVLISGESWKEEESVAKIKERLAVARRWTKPWHDNIDRWRALYDFEHYKGRAKPQEKRYADPTYTNTVDLAIGIMLANPIEFNAISWEPGAGEEDTDQVEKFLLGAIEVANDREDMNIPYEVLMNFTRDGGGCLYAVWDPTIAKGARTVMTLPDAESEQGVTVKAGYTELPIRTQAIDPREIMMLPGGPNRWQAIFRVVDMSVYDFESLYRVKLDDFSSYNASSKIEKKFEFVDYWRFADVPEPVVVEEGDEASGRPTEKTMQVIIHAVIYNDKFVPGFEVSIAKGYTELPYKVQFFKPVKRSDPKGFHSIIRPLETSVAMLEESINRRSRQIDVYSGLPMFVKAMAGRTVQIDAGFGNVPTLGADEDIAFPQWPGNAPDVSMHIDFIRSRIAQSGFSDVMYGGGSSSGMAGYALSLLGDQNRIRLEQPVSHLELLWGSWAKHILGLVKNFAADDVIRVYGRMRGADFAEQVIGREIADYLVKAIIRPEFPNDRTRNHAMAVQVKGILSDVTIMERYLDVRQPHDEEERKLIQIAKSHPVMQHYGLLVALKQMADDGDEAAKMTLVQLQQGNIPGMSGGGNTQSGPGNQSSQPGNALGTASASGAEAPQASGQPAAGQSALDQADSMSGAAPGMTPGGGAF